MRGVDVVEPGVQTTVQDAAGRTGQLRRGFSRSGPADVHALRAANLCVGNPADAAGIEIPMGRFKAVITEECTIAVTGADGAPASLNGQSFPSWEGVPARAGDQLRIGTVRGAGMRVYLAVAGGVDAPTVYDSRSTHLRARIGGFHGRSLRPGDFVPIKAAERPRRRRVPAVSRPRYATEWEVELVKGPYADPDYLTTEDWEALCSVAWSVDLNSDRSGTRLVGPRFRWARSDGGEGGAHPSNMVDGPYPPGGVVMTGDSPTILGPDGPVSGGFIAVATVPGAALWKVGQARPGSDTIRFREVTSAQAASMATAQEAQLNEAAMEDL